MHDHLYVDYLCIVSSVFTTFAYAVSLCPSLRISVCRALSRKHPLNSSTLYPNLRWWCIVLNRCVMHKNWDAIFKVKVTIRAYMIIMMNNNNE